VAGCRRNGWPGHVGTGGRITPEYATILASGPRIFAADIDDEVEAHR
jgi:hypothetical protein